MCILIYIYYQDDPTTNNNMLYIYCVMSVFVGGEGEICTHMHAIVFGNTKT